MQGHFVLLILKWTDISETWSDTFCPRIIASRFWHDLNLKADVRMLQLLKMKATALVFEPGRNYSHVWLFY